MNLYPLALNSRFIDKLWTFTQTSGGSAETPLSVYIDSKLLPMLFKLNMGVIRGPSSRHICCGLKAKPSPSKKGRKALLPTLAFIILGGLIFLVINPWNKPDVSRSIRSISAYQDYPDFFEREREFLERHKITEHVLQSGETLHDCFTKAGIPSNVAFEYIQILKKYLNPRMLRPGDFLKLFIDRKTNTLNKIVYKTQFERLLTVARAPWGLVASEGTIDYVKRIATSHGTIKNSLYETGLKTGIDIGLVLELADIFAWDIDFATDIRPNDNFKIIHEEYYRDGKWIKNGRILAAEFVNAGSKCQAFYFEDRKGHRDYYDSEGRCLRKQFLRSPLRYKRISSYFSRRRFHPILKIYRPHLGIDYTAPMSTPVESIGDGKIQFIGWKTEYGKFIRIKHNRNYVTTYGHLSRFAKRLKKGNRVKQGQVVGYVGSTGVSTGPHLDFRMIRNGRFVNPLKIKSPPTAPIRKDSIETFNATVLNLADRLEAISSKASAQVEEDTSQERKDG